MICLQQNSPITDYRVNYGRINTTEVRTVTTKDTRIFSEISNANNGLGILQIGEEYRFRVAARNADGQGPFSATFRATPLPFISGEYAYGLKISKKNLSSYTMNFLASN